MFRNYRHSEMNKNETIAVNTQTISSFFSLPARKLMTKQWLDHHHRHQLLRFYQSMFEKENMFYILSYRWIRERKKEFFDIYFSFKWVIVSFVLMFVISFVIQQQFTGKTTSKSTERLFTADELQSYTKDELYLALLGRRNQFWKKNEK